jgi:hypothetical protein
MTKNITVALLFIAVLSSAASAQYSRNFDDAAQANDFQTDRVNPGGFTVDANNNNELVLRVLGTDLPQHTESFFNYHGITTTDRFNAPRGSMLSVQVYIPASFNGTDQRGADLWARINDPAISDPGYHDYPTIGVFNVGNGAYVEAYNPITGEYDDVGATVKIDDWNTLGIKLTNSSIEYYFNDGLVRTDSSAYYSEPDLTLDQAYLQGWQGASDTANTDYSIRFDNLQVVVPEPTTLAGLLGLGGLALLRRRCAL